MSDATLIGVHKEKFKVHGKEITAVANFVTDRLHIYGHGVNLSMPLMDYTNFEGNMQDFLEYQLKGDNS